MKISKQGDRLTIDGENGLLLSNPEYLLHIEDGIDNLTLQNWIWHRVGYTFRQRIFTTWKALIFIWTGKYKSKERIEDSITRH